MDTRHPSTPVTKANLIALTHAVKGQAFSVSAVSVATNLYSTTTNTNCTSSGVAPKAAPFCFLQQPDSTYKPTKNFFMQAKLRMLVTSFIVSIITLFAGQAFGQATVASDKDDYAPLSQAVFTGAGFLPGETVQLKVKNLNRPCNTVSADSAYQPWNVLVNSSGGFVTPWTVCDCAGDSLRLKVTGITSGFVAYAYFTDGELQITDASPTPFSPNNSPTVNDQTQITITNVGNGAEGQARVRIRQGSIGGTIVFETTDLPNMGKDESQVVAWDGKYNQPPNAGNFVPDGSYWVIAYNAKSGGTETTGAGKFKIVVVDNTNPTVTINQAGAQADPTGVSPINFTVVFGESVSNFATGDVTLSGTALPTTAIVTGSGTTYNVAVSGMTANGTVIATIASGVASDAAGNNNNASSSSDNTVNYTGICVAPGLSTSQTNVSCNGGSNGSIILTVTGGSSPYTFAWTTTNGVIPSGQEDDQHLTGITAGTYAITVTATGGCQATLNNIVITQPPVVSLSATGVNVSCNGLSDGSINATSNGTVVIKNAADEVVGNTGLPIGSYTVYATNPGNNAATCSATPVVVVITEPAAVSLSATGTNVSCNGLSDGSISATSNGTIVIKNAANVTVSATGLPAGFYTVTATNPGNQSATCSATPVVVEITQPAAVTLSATGINVSCNGLSDGSINATSNGTIVIKNAANVTVGATGLPAGTYTVTATNPGNQSATCSATPFIVEITQPAAVTLTATGTNVTCNGLSNGSINATSNGTIVIKNASNVTVGATGLPAGFYTVTATNPGNQSATCSATPVIVEITQPAAVPAPTGSSTQAFLGSATVANLSATGSNIKWYATAGSTTQLLSSQALVTSSHYFATQTIGVCESQARLDVTAVITQQTITAIDKSVFCAGDKMTITFQTTGTYQAGNIFKAELSNGGGNFPAGSPTYLNTVSLTNDGTLNGVTTYTMVVDIPLINNAADHYFIRIDASLAQPGNVPLLGNTYAYANVGFIINPSPNVYNVTGGGSYCTGGAGVAIGLSNSQSGINYILYRYNSPTDSVELNTVPGGGGSISFGNQTVAGLYKVKAVFTNATGCSVMMTGSATVSTNALPDNTTAPTAQNATICPNSATNIVIANSASGFTYQLRLHPANTNVGTAVAGNNGQILLPTGNITGVVTYNVLVKNTSTLCEAQLATTVQVSAVDNQNPVVSDDVSIIASYNMDATQCNATLSFTSTATDNCGVANIKYYINYGGGSQAEITFPYDFLVGTTVVTAVATDVNGNIGTNPFSVVVFDNQNPVVTDPTVAASYNMDATQCNATLSFTSTATDNCSVANIRYYINYSTTPIEITFPYDFLAGTTVVTAVATDVNGNIGTNPFSVVVVDNQNPVVTDPTVAASYNMDATQCNASLSFTSTATDNCSVANIKYYINYSTTPTEITFPYDFLIGTTVVTAVATDVNGNIGTNPFSVVVVDNQNPVVTDPTVAASYNMDATQCNVTLSFTSTATDNCSVANIKYFINYSTTPTEITFPYDFLVGTTVVTAVATDVNGNIGTNPFSVVVVDNQNPVVTDPTMAASYNMDATQCNATLSFTSTATDNCSVANIKYYINYSTTPAEITFPYDFLVGTTTVTAVATDVNGNIGTNAFDVVVVDNQNPVVTDPTVAASYNMDATQCNATISFTSTATDNCSVANIKYYINYGGGSQAEITFPYDFLVGTTVVTALATDVNGNIGTNPFSVVVVDNQNPVVTDPSVTASYNMDATQCNATLSFTSTATDNCSVANIKYYINYGGGSQAEITFPYDFLVGTTVVTAVATDINGNIGTNPFSVVVVDNQNPVVTDPSVAASYNMDATQCNATLSFTSTATDNCSVSNIKYYINYSTTPTEITFPYDFLVGTTVVTAVATDVNGNIGTNPFSVVVMDNQNPVVTDPTVAASYNMDATQCNATLSFTSTATDNCSVANIKYYINYSTTPTEITFPYDFLVGTTVVTAVATDVNGNIGTNPFSVVVVDNQNPVVTDPTVAASYNTDATQCNATISFTSTATDNCSVANIKYYINYSTTPTEITFPYDFLVGTTVVTAVATDVNGNIGTNPFSVVVVDNQNPVVTDPTVAASYNMDATQCNATLSFTSTATDNCSVANIKYYINYGGGSQEEITFPYDFLVGTTVVTAVATDINGNIGTNPFSVVVVDNQNPVVTDPTVAASYNMDATQCNATLSFTSTATDNCSVANIKYYINYSTTPTEITFPYDFLVGTTVVTAVATDINGNIGTNPFSVVVVDNQNPVVTDPTVAASYNMDATQCNATLSFTSTATDNCSVANIKYYINYGTGTQAQIYFPYDFLVGTTTVTAVATDVNGNIGTNPFNVVVVDNQNPVVTDPTVAASYNMDATQCNATLSFTSTATDNCSVANIKYYINYSTTPTEITFPYDFLVGTTVVTAVATDVNGNIGTNSFDVVVVDNQNPVVTDPTVAASYNMDATQCNATLSFTSTATDNCSVANIKYYINYSTTPTEITFPYDFLVGTTTVTAVATDINGNIGTNPFDVVVVDNQNPVVTDPTVAASYNMDATQCNATLSFTSTATDNCSVANIKYYINYSTTPTEITFPYDFLVGTTTVTAVATDVNGNIGTNPFDVVVVDNQNPVVTDPTVAASYNMDATQCNATLSFTSTATDNCSVANIKYYINYSTTPIEITFPYDFLVGTTTVTAVATDVNGNIGTNPFNVVVVDNQNPVVTDPTVAASYNMDATQCNATLSFTSTATDNCSVANIKYYINYSTTPLEITFPYDFLVGTTVVTAVATDINGNIGTNPFSVVVVDNQNPVVTDPTVAASYNMDATQCNATLSFTSTATDNCSVANIKYYINYGTGTQAQIYFPYDFLVGTTTVTAVATDVNGNIGTNPFDVVVVDNQNPVVTDPTVAASYNMDATQCNATLSFTSTATDNCSVSNIKYYINYGTGTQAEITFPYDFLVGTTVVTAVATDVNGNIGTNPFSVVVVDNQNPVVTDPTVAASYNTDATQCNATISFTSTATDNCSVANIKYYINYSTTPTEITFPYDFLVGTTVVTAVATDVNGNIGTNPFSVVVVDNQDPVVTDDVSIAASYNTDAGECNATKTFTSTATDNCGIANIRYYINYGTGLQAQIYFPYDFPKGTTIVTAVATDINGRTGTNPFTIVVVDNQPPVLTEAADQNVNMNSANTSCSIIVPDVRGTATDNCPGTVITQLPLQGSTVAATHNGTIVVTVTATDAAGLTDVETVTLTAKDVTQPTITTCPTVAAVNYDPTECGALITVPALVATDNCEVSSLTYAWTMSGATSGSGTTASIGELLYNLGTTTIAWTVTDVAGNIQTCSTTVQVNPAVTTSTLTATPSSLQYSDLVTLKVVITNGASQCGGANAAGTATFTINGQTMKHPTTNITAIPFVVAANGTDLVAELVTPLLDYTYSSTATGPMAPGTNRAVSAVIAGISSAYKVNQPSGTTVTINKEDARIVYVGESMKATATATTNTATVVLSANIYDITALLPGLDANAGDIRNARVKFVLRNGSTSTDIHTDWLTPTLLNAGDKTIGNVSINHTFTIPSGDYAFFTVGIIVNNGGYYTRNDATDNTVITVYKPVGDFITGGGYIVPTESIGSMASDDNLKANFGFNVKFNKKNTNLQGNMNIIFRRTEADNVVHVYQIKANAMQSLGVNISDPANKVAEYLSKVNITDITNPTLPVSVGGGYFLFVKMIDKGEPGLNDMISFVLVTGSSNTPDNPALPANIIWSSNWVGNLTQLMTLSGGNIVVHSGFNLNTVPATTTTKVIQTTQEVAPTTIDLVAYPNPSSNQFNIKVSGRDKEKMLLRVVDMYGRVIETFNVTNGQTIQTGSRYKVGAYIIELIQGEERKQLKVIKS